MRRIPARRVAASTALLVLGLGAPVSAHALPGEVDAPLPFAAYVAGAVVAVVLSSAFAAIADERSAPAAAPGRVRTMSRPLRWPVQALGLGVWLWVVLQTIAGGTSDAEVASLLLWVCGGIA